MLISDLLTNYDGAFHFYDLFEYGISDFFSAGATFSDEQKVDRSKNKMYIISYYNVATFFNRKYTEKGDIVEIKTDAKVDKHPLLSVMADDEGKADSKINYAEKLGMTIFYRFLTE